MKMHLVGGFLGSGKTTSIIQAAKALMEQGCRVGVITNDQGRYLVDTAFFRFSSIPAMEVTGGCFCCNYNDLDEKLAQLVETAQPDVIFAESVGSCADIVATVVKPLLALRQDGLAPSSFSVFADVRLLHRRLLGQEMPFSDDVVYVFDKQIEEAGLLVVNKTDLVSAQVLDSVQGLLAAQYPQKSCFFQSSLTVAGVHPWLEWIQTSEWESGGQALEIDYNRYASGEARLAWLDQEIALRFAAGNGHVVLQQILQRIFDELSRCRVGVGHLKFVLQDGSAEVKLSFPAIAQPGDLEQVPEIVGSEVKLLVNARVEMPARDLRGVVHKAIDASGVEYNIKREAAFHPSPPKPTHRIQ